MTARAKALLLAGGLGTRLRPITETVPKCLVPVAGRPMLDYWLDALERAGIGEVLLNTHHLRDQVRDWMDRANAVRPIRVVEAWEPELLGSAGTVSANPRLGRGGLRDRRDLRRQSLDR
jgi:mannose-1-phosphate guanylyltransferase